MNIATSLSERAMLVSLTVSVWQARRYDRKVSQTAAAQYGTSEDSGRYNKRLLPPGAEAYEAVTKAATKARTIHYAQTLPWSEDGSRILPAANFLEYTRLMEEARREFGDAVSKFVTEYPALREEARALLNGMFQEADYPGAVGIQDRFRIETRIWPIPDAADFRVSLATDTADLLRAQIEAQTREALNTAMADTWRRLSEALSHMVGRLSEPEAIFRDSLFKNLGDLVELLPRLNVTEDPALEIVAGDIRKKLLGYRPEDARKSPEVRQALAQDAEAILLDMRDFYAA